MVSPLFIVSLLAFAAGGYLALRLELRSAHRSKQGLVNALGVLLLIGGIFGVAWAALA